MRTRARPLGLDRLAYPLAALAIVWAATTAANDDPKAAPAEGSAADSTARIMEDYQRLARLYRITLRSDAPTVLSLREAPLLRWHGYDHTSDDCALFLWTAKGRPEVVACFSRTETGQTHEFQSLSTVGLTAARGERTVWNPNLPGIMLVPIPGAPKPAQTPAERLDQMCSLAREFNAVYTVTDDPSPLELRTKPIYRYEPDGRDLADGALFTYFVWLKTPAILLLIEARPVADDLVWCYGFAPVGNLYYGARHRDKVVWQVGPDYRHNPTKTRLTTVVLDPQK